MLKTGLIINADDFGYNTGVNHAVVASFSEGLCSSTTIMANMPGFEEACDLYHEYDLADRVGLHLVLSEGVPLSDQIKRCPRVCDKDGRFRNAERQHLFTLNSAEKDAVFKEICAQIDRCRKNSIMITHIDSHHHVHIEWGIGSILLHIAKSKNLRYIRLSRCLDPDTVWFKKFYRRYFNLWLVLKGTAATKYFGTVEDFVCLKQKSKQNHSINSFEIMIHPDFNQHRILIDNVSKENLESYIARVDGYKQAVSFGHLAHA